MKELHLLVFGAILQVSHILMWNATLKLNLYGVLCTFFVEDISSVIFTNCCSFVRKWGKLFWLKVRLYVA